MKSFKVSLVVISVLVLFSIYQVYQNFQDADQIKDARIASLSKEVEWQDQIIKDLHKKLDAMDALIVGETIKSNHLNSKSNSTNNGSNIDSRDSKYFNDSSDINQPLQETIPVAELSSQLVDLKAKLEKKNNTLRNLNRLAPFSNINLTDDNLDGYFDRMIEITEGTAYNSEYLVNPDKYGKVVFNNSGTIPEESVEAFNVEKNRLYAHFELQDYLYEEVLIKWYQEGKPEPVELNYFEINQFGNENYAWIEPNSNWEPGTYFVEVFSASESPELLSAGSYLVEK